MRGRRWNLVWSAVMVVWGAFILIALADGTTGRSALSATLEIIGGVVLVVCGLVGIALSLRRRP